MNKINNIIKGLIILAILGIISIPVIMIRNLRTSVKWLEYDVQVLNANQKGTDKVVSIHQSFIMEEFPNEASDYNAKVKANNTPAK